ncbi:MAG: hydantoinase B/oxoprolinase family protein [Hyphomicrobiales bacterium]|nr:hydantoinase B/oxoprolinase family protein [Hyphomicrobiales bacterium]
MTEGLDSFRLDILSSALTALTEEIEITLLRSAYSQVVKEAQDASCAIFTAEGRIVAQPVVIPGHLGSMKYMLEACLDAYPAHTLTAGDVLLSNDPYQGGSHLPDIALYRPIFHGDALAAFAGCIIHYTDVGGMVPGSNPQRATELYQEGLVLPPVKLHEAGRPNETLRKLIRANVRNPDMFFGDLNAQESALLTGERRVRQLLERFGAENVRHAMDTLIAITEQKARAEVAQMRRGSYTFEDFMDHDGIDLSRPVGIRVKLDVLPARLRFDFTGTDPQVKGPLNAPLSKTWTTVFYCVMCALSQDVAFNDGVASIIEIHVPEGTVLNPHHPAPVNARSVTVNRVADVVLGALAQAVPGRIGAQACGVPTGVSFGGVDPRTGRNFVFYESYCGGMGATRTGDGADGISTGTSNAMNIPIEAIEIDYPIRIRRYELAEGTGGAGKFRGGLGLVREYEMLAETSSINVRGDRARFAPRGVHGGQDGAKSRYLLIEAEAPQGRELPSKFSSQIKRGDRLRVITPGGGGFGPPGERSAEAREHDLRNEVLVRDAGENAARPEQARPAPAE